MRLHLRALPPYSGIPMRCQYLTRTIVRKRNVGSRWDFDSGGALLVVHHTFENVDESTCLIRVISAREATKSEARQYEGGDK
jgi:uncharacterized DUF497 family protein